MSAVQPPPDETDEEGVCPSCLARDGRRVRLVNLLIHPDSQTTEKVGKACRRCKYVKWEDGTVTSVLPTDDGATAKVRHQTEGIVQEGAKILKKNPRAYERLWHYMGRMVVDADQYLLEAGAGKEEPES